MLLAIKHYHRLTCHMGLYDCKHIDDMMLAAQEVQLKVWN